MLNVHDILHTNSIQDGMNLNQDIQDKIKNSWNIPKTRYLKKKVKYWKIISSARDTTLWPNATDFEISAPEEFINVKQIEIIGSELTSQFFEDKYFLITSTLLGGDTFEKNIPNIFTKLNLIGEDNSILFNSFVKKIKEFKQPLAKLTNIDISLRDTTGSIVTTDSTFEWSVTLKITEMIDTDNSMNFSSIRGTLDKS
jgi:hypothetical protein